MHRRETHRMLELWPGELAVDIKGLRLSRWLSSDDTEGFDVILPRGKIYALLGPSGSGKTTLLRCILGLESAGAGSVRVFGQVPGSPGAIVPGSGAGYVPQNIMADIGDRSAEEVFRIYGEIHGIPNSRLEERVDEVFGFLPEQWNYRRKLDFGIAIIHSPPLLVLEYPTLGLWPNDRERVWEYLRSLSQEHGTTILFTSDDPDEASRADIIGYMECFRLRLQGPPHELVRGSGSEGLKELLVKLQDPEISDELIGSLSAIERACKAPECCVVHVGRGGTAEIITPSTTSRIEATPPTGITFIGISERLQSYRTPLRRIRALLPINFDPASLSMILFVAFLFSVIYRNDGAYCEVPLRWFPVAVVNTDVHPHFSRSFLESLPSTTIVQRTYLEVGQAIASTERDENSGVIIIGRDFSNILKQYLHDENEQNETTVEARINIDIDSSDAQTAYVLRITIHSSFEKFFKNLLSDNGRSVSSPELPLRITHARFGAIGTHPDPVKSFLDTQQHISGSFHSSVVFSAVLMTLELRGTDMELLGLANVNPLEVILSHLISLLPCILCLDLMVLSPGILSRWPTDGSLIASFMLRSLHALQGITLGQAIAFGIELCSSRSANSLLASVFGMGFALFVFPGASALLIQSVPATILRFLVHGCSHDGFTESLLCVWNHGLSIDVCGILTSFVYPICRSGFFLFCAFVLSKCSKHRRRSHHPKEEHDIR